MDKALSYASLLEFIGQQWELNNRQPSINIHRNSFVDAFGDVGFQYINQFLRDLDERYHAIRVTRYAYLDFMRYEGKNYEDYTDMSAEEILLSQGLEPTPKNIDAVNLDYLTTDIVVEPDFLNIIKSFENPWQEATEPPHVEELTLAKLKLSGNTFWLEFEGKKLELWTYKSKKYKGYLATKSLLEAKSKMCLKDGLTKARLLTNTTQLPVLLHLDKDIEKFFYRHTATHVALNHRIELNHHDAQIVRNYVNRKIRQKRES